MQVDKFCNNIVLRISNNLFTIYGDGTRFRTMRRGAIIGPQSLHYYCVAFAKTLITYCFVNGEKQSVRFATETFLGDDL